MKTGKRDAKRQVDQLLYFASLKKMSDLTEPELQRVFRQFFEILHGREKEKVGHYDALSLTALDIIRGFLQKLAGQLHALIQKLCEEAGSEVENKNWRAIPRRPFKFHVSYDVYFKEDRVSVRPLGDTRLATKAWRDEKGGVMRSLEEQETFELLKFRFFSLLEKAALPLSSIRVCTKCKCFFSATERKEDKRCRKCLQRAIRRRWGKERGR